MMGAQFGSIKIGEMQYGGVTIGEAMMDGQIVYRSVIRVTPAAPTFLTASPWVTLPTQAGVTYTVSGTPGYSQSVTVTATAQAGYELVGKVSWTHNYPSFYPVSGSWPDSSLPVAYGTIFDSHTIVESGSFTVTCTVQRTTNGTVFARFFGPWGYTSAPSGGATSTATGTHNLTPGQVIDFSARATDTGRKAVGTWSIVKN